MIRDTADFGDPAVAATRGKQAICLMSLFPESPEQPGFPRGQVNNGEGDNAGSTLHAHKTHPPHGHTRMCVGMKVAMELQICTEPAS